MSGHSKWSTIKHKKAITDQRRGKIFSRLSKGLIVAIKTGGGNNPNTNYKLKVAIEKAKTLNMPKNNIERILKNAEKEKDMEEIVYEGFGPGGFSIIVETATDNRNRTVAEIKKLFEKNGGRVGGPGSVAFNFLSKGMLLVKKKGDVENQILKIMDLDVEDVEEVEGVVEVITPPTSLSKTKDEIEKLDFKIISFELVQNPKNLHSLKEKKEVNKALSFLEKIEDHDDVQKVFSNLDFPEELIK